MKQRVLPILVVLAIVVVLIGRFSGNGVRVRRAGTNDPIVSVEEGNARMAAAEAEARARWSEFEQAWRGRASGQAFFVKKEFKERGHSEFMWMQVERIDDVAVHGVLGNDPEFVRSVRAGDPVSCPIGEINDWMIADSTGEAIAGGFTTAVLKELTRGR